MPDPFAPEQKVGVYKPPSLQQRISAAIDALRGKVAPETPVPAPSVKTTPETPPQAKTQDDPAGRALPDANFISPFYAQWRDVFYLGVNRSRRYADYDTMDTGYVSAMLDAIVDACLVSDDGEIKGFKVQAKSAKIQNVLDQVVKDTNLTFLIRNLLRDLLKYGDNWIGYVFDENWNIVDLDNPPPHQMYAFTDEHLRLLTGEETVAGNTWARAFQQKNSALTTVAAWNPFEMVHLKWKPSKRLIYSEKSFLEDFRADFYKLKLVEESLVMHRITRASPRLLHMLDVTGKTNDEAIESLNAYVDMLRTKKATNGEQLSDTIAVDEDYQFTTQYRTGNDGKLYPSLNNVSMLDPRNTGLTQLPDVDYLRKKLFSRVPSEIVGILSDREDISTQDIASSRLYTYCQDVLRVQFLIPLFNLALLLKGYKPEEGDYKVIFPDVQLRSSWRFADAQFRQSMADANEISNGTNNRKSIAMQKHGWTETEWDEHVKQYQKEKEVFEPIAPTDTGKQEEPKAKSVDKVRGGNKAT